MDECLTDQILERMNNNLDTNNIYQVKEDFDYLMKDEDFDKDEFGMARSMLHHKKFHSVSKIQVDHMYGRIDNPTNFKINKDFEYHLRVRVNNYSVTKNNN